MPSRFASLAIVVFWFAVVGYLGYTRVLPWLTASSVPTITVSATDEASQMKVRWSILFNNEKAGFLITELKADEADTHTFVASYKDVKLTLLGASVRVPTATTEVAVDRRTGFLRRQSANGTAAFSLAMFGVPGEFTGSATVTSRVINGELRGQAEGTLDVFRLEPTDLPPVPVPSGQVLNPLMPLNRLSGVEPGKTWRIRQVDPLGDSLKQLFLALAKKHGFGALVPGGKAESEELLAEVTAETEAVVVRRNEESVSCWVIVYRGKDNKIVAKTWVSVADGRVMRQQATVDGNTLRLDRDE